MSQDTSLPRRFIQALLGPVRAIHGHVLMPLATLGPAPLAYRLAVVRGDLEHALRPGPRRRLTAHLAAILGDALSPEERARAVRDYCRLRCCALWDGLRLRGEGRALARLVDVQGREHLEAALAQGHGALLFSGHIGSFESAIEVLGAKGSPVTLIRRSADDNYNWAHYFCGRIVPMRRTFPHKPAIDASNGQFAMAAKLGLRLRHNEPVVVLLDPQPTAEDLPRAQDVAFLGGRARLLTGAITVAQRTGTPLLFMRVRRHANWYRQTVEILPPISSEGSTVEVFQRCLALIEAEIRARPGAWFFFGQGDDLRTMGLLERAPGRAASYRGAASSTLAHDAPAFAAVAAGLENPAR